MSEDGLRLFTLNISGPSVERAGRLTEYLLSLDADVLVLTETRANAGTALLVENLVGAGYRYEMCRPRFESRERGVAVLSRRVLFSGLGPSGSVDLPHRLVVGDIGLVEPLQMIAAYVPSRDASQPKIERKRRFLEQMIEALERTARAGRTIFVGDLNIVTREHEPQYKTFKSWEYEAFDRIANLGLVDAFAQLHPGEQAHSWIGRTGNGYRYDYAFVSRDLVEYVRTCTYMHEPRNLGLSDHAGVLLELSIEFL